MCCQRASAVGGDSFLVDLELCLSRLPGWAATRLLSAEFERTVALPPNYDTFALADGLDHVDAKNIIATGRAKQIPTTVRDRLCTQIPGTNRRFLKGNLNEFELDVVDAMRSQGPQQDALVRAAISQVYSPVTERSAEDGALDMRALCLYLREVAKEEQAADRVRLQPGEAIVVDNYRCDHGREGYTDRERSMWQLWVWSAEAAGFPDDPGPGRAWLTPPVPGLLTEGEWAARFAADGFLAVPQLLTADEVVTLRTAAEAVLAQWEAGHGAAESTPPPSRDPNSHVMRNLTHPIYNDAGREHYLQLLEVAASPKLLRLARAAFGGAEPMFRATSLFFAPRGETGNVVETSFNGSGEGAWHRVRTDAVAPACAPRLAVSARAECA